MAVENLKNSASSPTLLYAICVVQNEEDVVIDCIRWAEEYCDGILIWDLGSTDDTWTLLNQLKSDKIWVYRRADLLYGRQIISQMIEAVRRIQPPPTWIYKLDADEFLAQDPRPILTLAEQEGAEVVHAWHMHFCITPEDVQELLSKGESAWSQTPLFERLKHYQVRWREWRFVKSVPDLAVNDQGSRRGFRHADGRKLKRSRHTVMIRHYRYRSPVQIERRFQTRQRIRSHGYSGFRYDIGKSLSLYTMPTHHCRLWRGKNDIPRVRLGEYIRYKFKYTQKKIMNRIRKLRIKNDEP